MGKNIKAITNAWCMYDWANSVYSLVITTTIFPIYYNAVTTEAFGSNLVNFLGFQVTNTVLYSYSISFSFLIVFFVLPVLAGIADFGGKRKIFMKFFAYLGAASCASLYFFTGENIVTGILFSMLASIGFAGSLVFYNSYLPIITTPDRFDMVSARGFSLGYAGSVILLVASLIIVTFPNTFGFEDTTIASRFTFLIVGIWWAGFAQITFYYLPADNHGLSDLRILISKGYQEIRKVFAGLHKQKHLSRFLAAFFFYNMGVQTVIYLAALFGDAELHLSANSLIITILIIQIVAIAGSYLFAWISGKKGNKFSLVTMVVIWMFVCGFAFFIYTSVEFYILGFIVGMVMGGIQSLSRASYSKLIPKDTINTTSYFSFYDILEKLSIVIGTFAYGLIEQISGSMRNSTLALTIFFIIGLLFLLTLKIPSVKSTEG